LKEELEDTKGAIVHTTNFMTFIFRCGNSGIKQIFNTVKHLNSFSFVFVVFVGTVMVPNKSSTTEVLKTSISMSVS
jgi:hypothetical protein